MKAGAKTNKDGRQESMGWTRLRLWSGCCRRRSSSRQGWMVSGYDSPIMNRTRWSTLSWGTCMVMGLSTGSEVNRDWPIVHRHERDVAMFIQKMRCVCVPAEFEAL